MMRDPICFNANCHTTVFQNIKADQLLPHVKDCFARGGIGLVSCIKCLEAFTQSLAEKETTHPPNTVCQICAGVNGSEMELQFYANGEFSLWICSQCQTIQSSVIHSNFYLPQKLVPTKKSIELYTFDLPKEPPKKRFLPPPGRSRSPPPKRKAIIRPSFINRTQQPWETTIIAAANQQEKILAALEQMDLLQKQQARNLRSIQSAVPSLLDVDVLKSANDKLESKVERISKKWKEAEEQKSKIKELAEALRADLSRGNPEAIEKLFQSIEEFTAPLPEEVEEEEEEKKTEETKDEEEEDIDMIKADDDSPTIVASTE